MKVSSTSETLEHPKMNTIFSQPNHIHMNRLSLVSCHRMSSTDKVPGDPLVQGSTNICNTKVYCGSLQRENSTLLTEDEF